MGNIAIGILIGIALCVAFWIYRNGTKKPFEGEVEGPTEIKPLQ